MTRTSYLLLSLFLLVSLSSCKKDGAAHAGHVQELGPKSRIINHEGFRFLVDLISAPDHDRMAVMMGSGAGGGSDINYYVSLTIVDLQSKKPVGDASVIMVVTDATGTRVSAPSHLMQGRGMAHYMVGFKRRDAGVYATALEVQFRGATHKHSVSFKVE